MDIKDLMESHNVYYETRNENYKYINRHKVIGIDDSLSGCMSYIFFTKPELNIDGDTENDFIRYMYNNRDTRKLVNLLNGESSAPFLTPLSNLCLNYDAIDDTLEITKTAKTFKDYYITYAGDIDASKAGNVMNFSFTENRYMDIYNIMKIWCEYMSGVYSGVLTPKMSYIDDMKLDYTVSVYYFLVESDGCTIKFYSRLTGAFPTAVPNSAYSHRKGNNFENPEISIPFQFSKRDDNRPIILEEFNDICSGGGEVNGFNHETGLDGTTWCTGVKVVEKDERLLLEFYSK